MKLLVVYDFDWSLVDQDSDRYVFEVLSPKLRQRLRDKKATTQWTDLMHENLGLLHQEGITRAEIEKTLRNLPFHPAQRRAILTLAASTEIQTTFFLLTNANTTFVENVLGAQGMTSVFHQLVTNPSAWTGERLNVSRRCPPAPHTPQHGCRVGCSENMCKGAELDAFMDRVAKGDMTPGMQCPPGVNAAEMRDPQPPGWPDWDKVIYIGDGGNDFCPLLRLREQDLALVRRGKSLETRVKEEAGLRCQVIYWSMADEIERVFETLQGRGW